MDLDLECDASKVPMLLCMVFNKNEVYLPKGISLNKKIQTCMIPILYISVAGKAKLNILLQ
jgi:hypothetical protein